MWAAALGLLLAATAWGMQRHVVASAEAFCVAAAEVPVVDCILVPGARIHADGRPYSMLVDRLAGALDLYRRQRAARVVVSGRGGGGLAVDEVGAMRRWLVERGVPAEAILGDGEGLRTIDSLRRVRDVFGCGSVVVVTNDFHAARTVFLGRRFGLDAYAVAAAPQYDYSWPVVWKNRGREFAARVRAWLDAYAFGACE